MNTRRPGRCVCPRRCVRVQNIFLVLCFYTWSPDVKLLILTVIIILCLIQRRNSMLRKTCIRENSSTKTWSLYNKDREARPSVWPQDNQSHPAWFSPGKWGIQCYLCKILLLKYFLQLRTGWFLREALSTFSLRKATQTPACPNLCPNSTISTPHPPDRNLICCLSDDIWSRKCTFPVSKPCSGCCM